MLAVRKSPGSSPQPRNVRAIRSVEPVQVSCWLSGGPPGGVTSSLFFSQFVHPWVVWTEVFRVLKGAGLRFGCNRKYHDGATGTGMWWHGLLADWH